MIALTLESGLETIRPLLIFVIGMVIYSLFIFKFYRFVATKDIFDLNLQQYNTHKGLDILKKFFSVILYILEYLIIFPIFVSFWFAVFAILLLVLSHQSVETVLLISMTIVTTVRVCAYFSEDLSKDLSKMLPFALLGVFLVDISFFDISKFTQAFYTIPSLLDVLLYYLIFTLIVEFSLRVLNYIFSLLFPDDVEEIEED